MTDSLAPGTAVVLLVEDNEVDAEIIVRAFAATPSQPRVVVVTDGDEAIAYLHREGEHAGAELPDLVLLDLGLPATDGYEVLSTIKSDPALRQIPAVVVTGSMRPDDVTASYGAHANAYVPKPRDAKEMAVVVARLEEFFFQTAHLPGRYLDLL